MIKRFSSSLKLPVLAPVPVLSHVGVDGKASMVDVGGKGESKRTAMASATVILGREAFLQLEANGNMKGDVLGVSRIAGIMGAKQTSSLVPLCHPLLLSHIALDFNLDKSNHTVKITSSVACKGQTGVEMEALTAVSIASLTIYDMCKAVDKGIIIKDIHLISKTGGKSEHGYLFDGARNNP